jgi:hypothetical protein
VEPESAQPAAAVNGIGVGPPAPVRAAGVCVALEGLTGVGIAASLVVRGLLGHSERAISNYGTAAWFLILGAAVLAAGAALALGKRGGYVIALMAQVLLLPVAWSLLTGSNQLLLGAALGAAAVATLGLLCTPAALRWKSGG